MLVVTIDGVTTVPEFGGWACYDHGPHRWLSPDRIKSAVSAWFERNGSQFSGKTLDEAVTGRNGSSSKHREKSASGCTCTTTSSGSIRYSTRAGNDTDNAC